VIGTATSVILGVGCPARLHGARHAAGRANPATRARHRVARDAVRPEIGASPMTLLAGADDARSFPGRVVGVSLMVR
jgi:hypothetical protein